MHSQLRNFEQVWVRGVDVFLVFGAYLLRAERKHGSEHVCVAAAWLIMPQHYSDQKRAANVVESLSAPDTFNARFGQFWGHVKGACTQGVGISPWSRLERTISREYLQNSGCKY